jgi:hypothetical protein
MSEKEINPLKRGRMQGRAREQKKKTTLGEISDPFTVLNDSIAAKNQRHQNPVRGDYVPSEKADHGKTTTVDTIDPLSDADHPSRGKISETRPLSNGKRGAPRDGRRSESSPGDSNRTPYDEARHGHRSENGRRSESGSGDGNRTPCDEVRRGHRSEERNENLPLEPKPKCGIKCLLNKILSLLNLGPRNKNCDCRRKNSRESEEKRCGTNSRCANARGGRNRFRSSQNKFK